jgi:ABC-type phosphate transport system substrate-binding protein
MLNNTNSVGYLEYGQAVTNNIRIIRLRNREGLYHVGDTEATEAAAAASLVTIPDATADHAGFSIANAFGIDSYSMSTFSYVLLRTDYTDKGAIGWYNKKQF